MPLIHRRTIVAVALFVGLPLVWVGCEGDPARAAAPPAKCKIGAVEANKSGNGWIGFGGEFSCKNHDPDTMRITFQILRNGESWRIMHARTQPVQFTTRCRRGGKTAEFRGRLSINVKDAKSERKRFFTKTGNSFHWRCLPR